MSPATSDQQVTGLLRETLERLDPAPATDPAMLAAHRRALVSGGDGGGGRQVQADDTQWLALEELSERLDAIRREAAAPAPVAVSTDSGVGGPPVPPAPDRAAGSHPSPPVWLPAPTAGERAGSAGHPPAYQPPAAPAYGSTDPCPVRAGTVPLTAAPTGGQGRLAPPLDRLLEAAGPRPGAGRLGWRVVVRFLAVGAVLGLVLCMVAVTVWLYLPHNRGGLLR
jgi:hypothetical protein